MSLYSALPPAQGQALTTAATSTPAAAATAASSRVTPPRFIPLRPSMPSIPRALLNRPTQLSKPHPPPPPSTSAVPSPTHQPILPSSTQLLLAELEAADDGDDGDEELQLALDTLPDVYQPRKPNEWQQYVEWKEQKEAAQAEAEAEESRKRAAEQLNEATVDDDTQHSKRQQRSFHYAYKSSADHEESVPSEKSQTAAATLPSPPPAALVAAPLADKQAMLAVASGEDAYMRRMKMSSQSTTAINAATDAASHQHRHPSPPTISLPRITLPLPPPPPARPAQPSTTPLPSTTTQSRNMVARGEVDADLEDETADECRKYGPVQRCTILALPSSSGARDEEAVRIFVHFADTDGAKRAVQGLQGRYFGKRRVECVLYDEHRFTLGQLI